MTKQVRRIESRENKLFKSWLKLLQPQGVNKSGQFILSGEKLIAELLQESPELAFAYLKPENSSLALSLPSNLDVFELKKALFKELDALGTEKALLVCDLPAIKDWSDAGPVGLEVFLALQDPGNLGAAIRSAVAFGASKVVILKESAHPFSPKALKASAGATLKIPLLWGPSIQELEAEQKFLVLDGSGADLDKFVWPKNVRLLVGEEGRGVPEKLKIQNHTLAIQISPHVESLNASIALGIALHRWSKS